MNKDMLLGEALSLLKVYKDGMTSYSLTEATRSLVKKIEESYSESANPVSPNTECCSPPPSNTPPWQSNG